MELKGPPGYEGEVGRICRPSTPCPIFLVCVDDGVRNSETVTLQVGQAWSLDQFESVLSSSWEFQVETFNRHLDK